jgi:ribokinase
MRTPQVWVLGSANLDWVIRGERCPLPGETLMGRSLHAYHGGKGANQAVACARMGAAVAFVGGVGVDAQGIQLEQGLAAEGISLQGLQRLQTAPSGQAFIVVADSGENSIVVVPGANRALSPREALQALSAAAEGDLLLVSLEVDCTLAQAALAQARSRGLMTVLNVSPWPEGPWDEAAWSGARMLILNEHEASLAFQAPLAGPSEALQAARAALERQPLSPWDVVVVTLGAQGVVVAWRAPNDGAPERAAQAHGASEGSPDFGSTQAPARQGPAGEVHPRVQACHWSAPALTGPVLDTTGAGDTFAGAWVSALAQGLSLEEAVGRAQAAAALSVTRMGAQASMPYLKEVM